MKGIFQLVSHEDGSRSESFNLTVKEMGEVFKKAQEEGNLRLEDYVLMIADITDTENNDTRISTAPLIQIKTFMELHAIEWKEEANG